MKADLLQNPTSNSLLNTTKATTSTTQSSLLTGCLGSLDGACIEKLLLHCANALESNDVTLAQQVMWVLNNIASLVGDPNQRLTAWFLRALIARASKVCPPSSINDSNFDGGSTINQRRLMTVTELAGYVDLIPWHRFGFCASNSLISKAIQGFNKVHILDFSITHCMQWPTLIDALAKRPEGPPSLRISVPSIRPPVPPFVNLSIEEVGLRLANFARFRDVPFEFNVIESKDFMTSFDYESLLNITYQEEEALVINCQNWIRYLSDEDHGNNIGTNDISLRDSFLDIIKGLDPCLVIVVDEDSDMSGPSLASRITSSFNYLWIPFDALETFLPKDSRQRIEFESDIGLKIENIVSFEGGQRIERLESGIKLSQRIRSNGFLSAPFCEETVKEVKGLLDEHASGWGMKRDDDMLVLTWKGHNSVFATAWVPSPCGSYVD